MTETSDATGLSPATIRKTILWVIVGALGLSAAFSIFWVMLGDRMGSVAGSAFLTIGLVTLFAIVSLAEVNAGESRPQWVTVSRMVTLAVTLLVGVYFIWGNHTPLIVDYPYSVDPWVRFMNFVFVLVPVTQLAMLHLSLTAKRLPKYDQAPRWVALSSIAAVCLVAVLIVIQVVFYRNDMGELYWRSTAALSIIAAVLTILPLVIHAIQNPKPAKQQYVAPPAGQQPPPYPVYPVQQPYDPSRYPYPTPPAVPPFDPSQR